MQIGWPITQTKSSHQEYKIEKSQVASRGRFLVRIFILVWAPRGLIGPGFGLPWPAGGQVGWPSRWDHFSGPGGRTAGRFPFPRVRFQRWPCWGPKSSRSVASTVLVPLCGAAAAPPSGTSRTKTTELVLDLEQVSFSDLLGQEGGLRAKTAARKCHGSGPSTLGT